MHTFVTQVKWYLLSVRFLSIVLNDLRSHEWRRSSKTLSAGRQDGSTHSVVCQLDDRWNDRVRVWTNQRPHQNVLRLEVTVDDLLTVQVAQCCCHLVADTDINVWQTIMTMMMMMMMTIAIIIQLSLCSFMSINVNNTASQEVRTCTMISISSFKVKGQSYIGQLLLELCHWNVITSLLWFTITYSHKVTTLYDQEFIYRQTDRQTDRQKDSNTCFSQYSWFEVINVCTVISCSTPVLPLRTCNSAIISAHLYNDMTYDTCAIIVIIQW